MGLKSSYNSPKNLKNGDIWINKGVTSAFKMDSSMKLLLISNIFTIILAIFQKWSITEIMFIYCMQSIFIGFFQFLKILEIEKFSTTGMKINNQPAKPTQGTKMFTAFFFLFHYGFFHFVYLMFLFPAILFSGVNFLYLSLSLLILFGNHLYSYLKNREIDKKKEKNIGMLMFGPYLRIIPMHVAILFGWGSVLIFGSSIPLVIFFMILKTIGDMLMHGVEHMAEDKKLEKANKESIEHPERFFKPSKSLINKKKY